MTVDRKTWWFLDLAVRGGRSLGALSSPNIEAIFNREHHGLDFVELRMTVRDLMQAGLIEVRSLGGHVVANAAELNVAFRMSRWGWPPTGYWYYLTKAGGALWETAARPTWDRLVQLSVDGNRRATLEARSRDKAEAEFLAQQLEHPLLEGTRNDEVLRPWEALYWKRLPDGYRISWSYEARRVQPFSRSLQWYSDPFRR